MDKDDAEHDGALTAPEDSSSYLRRAAVTARTVLPSPIANLVSLAVAGSSVGLRIGATLGSIFISGARIGTLSGFELSRTIIEGILTRAGQDVADSSGPLGRQDAETLLSRALATLHYSITQTSFFISTGFQLGSTTLNTSLSLAQYFVSALDVVLGDTETSKAIATIVILVQKEIGNPETGTKGEKLSFGDLTVGFLAFALLQRWCKKRTTTDLKNTTEETIWDLVVVEDDLRRETPGPDDASERPSSRRRTLTERSIKERPISFVSAYGDDEPFDAMSIRDGASALSVLHAQSNDESDDELEMRFRNALGDQLSGATMARGCNTVGDNRHNHG